MLHSFRLKIGLVSLSLSGALLLGFALYAFTLINRVGLDRIDSELRVLADAQVRKIQPPEHWRRFDESFRSIYGSNAIHQFAIKVTRRDKEPVFTTPDWPADLNPDSMPLAVRAAPLPRIPNPAVIDPPPPDAEEDKPPRPSESERPRTPPPQPLALSEPVFATFTGAHSSWRIMTIANEYVILSIAMNLADLNAETGRFRKALLIAVPLGLILILAGSWLLGHMALRPVNAIARTAESVTARRLNERIPIEDADDEFKHLIVLINDMLERLERSFQQATRFSADAAHELKTPLAILQAQTERCLQLAPDGSKEQGEYAEQLDEVQRLKIILGKLLLLSRADSGQLPVSPTLIDMAEMVRAAAEDVQMLAPNRKLTVTAPQSLPIMADADLLNQVFDNLISNAVKFGDKDSSIEMTLQTHDNFAEFTISSIGPTIPAQDQGKVFDRFYRADKARSRKIEGSGLGLSLAREMARAHGGDLILEQSENNITRFKLTLPVSGDDFRSENCGRRGRND